MGPRSKVLLTLLIVGVVIGVVVLQSNNKSIFKGQIELQDKNNVNAPALPDLKASLVVVAPENGGSDLKVNVTITNIGPGTITGEKSFKYTIYINNTEVFSNTDSYSTMSAGDSFNFAYPISRAIYNYPDSGTAKVVVDTANFIKETDEKNNEAEVKYELK